MVPVMMVDVWALRLRVGSRDVDIARAIWLECEPLPRVPGKKNLSLTPAKAVLACCYPRLALFKYAT